jgi:WD40 repeat protein
VYRARAGKTDRVVCACGCGAAGAPEVLGWMGATCGPCGDRAQEAGAGALRANAPGVLYGERHPLGSVACSPDGAFVAACEGDHCVTLWNVRARARYTFECPGLQPWDVALAPDARYLLVGGRGSFGLDSGLWAAFDLTVHPPARVKPTRDTDPMTVRVIARPDGRAVVHRFEPLEARTFADVVAVPSGARERSVTLPAGALGRAALSPDGTRVAVAGYRVAVLDLATGASAFEVAAPSSRVAFSHDGTTLYGDFDPAPLGALDATTGRAKGSVPKADRDLFRTTGPVKELAVDPGGAFVYAGTSEGWVVALDAKTLAVRAAFEWHMGAVAGLAVTADGTRLFSSGRDGCVKVWPIRDLLACA